MNMFWKGAGILSEMALISLLTTYSLTGPVSAQFPPQPQGITYLQSKFHENVTISFKEVSLKTLVSLGLWRICFLLTRVTKPGLCETTPGVKSYAGYVHLPPNFLDDMSDVDIQNYPINT